MFQSIKKFIFTLLLIALIIAALGYGMFLFVIPQHYFPLFPLIPVFLFIVTITVHAYLIKASENNPRKFTASYLGAMAVKMLIYLVFLIVYLFLDTTHAVPFLVSFLASYAAFTTYEVISILNYLKKEK
jgi:hypothetical protein